MMTTTTGHPLRTGQLRRAGWLMKLPRVVIAALLWLLVIEAVPAPAAWGVLAVVVGGTVAAVVAEPVIVWLLWWARRPSTPIPVPGDPQVHVLVTRRRAAGIGPAGRRHLIVPLAWVGRPDLPELLRRARQRQLVAAGHLEVAYQWFTWPWQMLASFAGGFAHGLLRLPLVGFAWRVRVVVAGIAVWQTIVAGRLAPTVGIVVVIGLTYLLPWTELHHARLVHRAVGGLERPLAAPTQFRPATRPAQRAPANGHRRPGANVVRRTGSSCGRRRPAAQHVSCQREGISGLGHGHRTTGTKGFQS